MLKHDFTHILLLGTEELTLMSAADISGSELSIHLKYFYR
jgi:hypothetical protein